MIDAFPLFQLEIQAERGVFCMYMKDAIAEYGFDCRIRKLSPRTIDNYTKQLRYFQVYLEQTHAVIVKCRPCRACLRSRSPDWCEGGFHRCMAWGSSPFSEFAPIVPRVILQNKERKVGMDK